LRRFCGNSNGVVRWFVNDMLAYNGVAAWKIKLA